jgi:hypothetical protein
VRLLILLGVSGLDVIKHYGASSPVRATAAPFTAAALLIQLPVAPLRLLARRRPSQPAARPQPATSAGQLADTSAALSA